MQAAIAMVSHPEPAVKALAASVFQIVHDAVQLGFPCLCLTYAASAAY